MNRIVKWISFTAIALVICSSITKPQHSDPYKKFVLPGTIKLDENFYCDQMEITNFHWLEYLYWKEKTFGQHSNEYKNALPDTTVWLKEDSCLQNYVEHYLRHPAYRDYPVVGITQKQAQDYSIWRSDRVFEYLLVKNKVIQWDYEYDSTDYFTIEKYYRGTYKNITPNPNYMYYPVYRLPSSKEQSKMSDYNSSFGKLLSKTKKLDNCLRGIYTSVININPCPNDSTFVDPTVPVDSPKSCERFSVLYHLEGNVAELTSDGEISLIRNWKADLGSVKPFKYTSASSCIGFRSVAQWKKWVE